VTDAVAVIVVSATEVAVIVTVLGEGAGVGAVYTPLASIEPRPVGVVGTDQVTFRQVGFEVTLQPGLLTVAVKVKCSPVPRKAPDGVIEMLIPVIIVNVAVAVFVVSAAAVPVMVTEGSAVTTLEIVAVGMVAGAL
jgi:hypothetical protein